MDTIRTGFRPLLRQTSSAVRAFVTEVAAATVLARPPRLSLLVRSQSIEVMKQDGGRAELAMTAQGRTRDAVGRVVEWLGAAPEKECAIILANELAVTRRLILPAEGREILEAIVRNKVESIGPWPLAQSLYGLRVAPVPGDPAHVAVDVGVVSRALFEEIARELSAAGTVVTAASLLLADGESLDISAGWKQETADAFRQAARLAWGFAALAALAAGIGLLLAWQSASRLAADTANMAALTASLEPDRFGDPTTPLQAANRLHERRLDRTPAVAVLDELSALLPPNVWLISLSLDDLRVELRGQGSDVPSLIEILEQSGSFRDVNFTSATQLNEDLNAETFAIGATLEPPAQEGQP